MNDKNEDTLWQTMVYDQHYGREIFEGLKKIYVLLRSGGDQRIMDNLYVDRLIIIPFGNTMHSAYASSINTMITTIIFNQKS